MASKEDILKKFRANVREKFDMPPLDDIQAVTYPDPLVQFIRMSESVGGQVLEVAEGRDLNALIRQIYPDAGSIASNLPGVKAELNPDTVAQAQELETADVGVIQGYIGVAENACVWIPQTMKERAVCFASQRLVILLSKENIVNNMHEAYARIEQSDEYFRDYKFGTFISGPSKTADIEGALVYGAQAARAVTIVLF